MVKISRLKRLQVRGRHSLQQNGLRETLGKGLTVVQQNQPFRVLDPYFTPFSNIKSGYLFQSESPPSLLKAKIISDQYYRGSFTRYDLFAFVAGLNGEQNLYSKVSNQYEHLYPLDNSVLDEVDEYCPVSIRPNGRLVDVGFFAKLLLDTNKNVVPVEVSSSKSPPIVTRGDLTDVLNETELRKIDQISANILKSSGYLFQSVIWPPGQQFQDEIEDEISQYGNVLDVVEIELGEFFSNFVDDVYLTQFSGRVDLATQKETIMNGVRKKRDIMCKYGTSVTVLFIELPEPKIRDESAVMSEIKLSCRNELEGRLDEEQSSEIIVHATDNFTHNLATMDVLNQYLDET